VFDGPHYCVSEWSANVDFRGNVDLLFHVLWFTERGALQVSFDCGCAFVFHSEVACAQRDRRCGFDAYSPNRFNQFPHRHDFGGSSGQDTALRTRQIRSVRVWRDPSRLEVVDATSGAKIIQCELTDLIRVVPDHPDREPIDLL
jgi:hypothetical protein